MANSKILVTGGAGYIGSHTVVELHNSGFTPIIIDDFSNSQKEVIQRINKITGDEIKWYEGDCRDKELIDKIFLLEKDIEGVIHFAASKAVGESVENPLKYYDNNIGSLLTLLNSMAKADVRNFVFSSSCTVYGQSKSLPVTEESPVLPAESPYGNTKQIGEEILRDLCAANKELSVISLRYFNPIGAHDSALIGELPTGVPNNLVPYITQTAVGIREKLTVFGGDYNTPDGTCIRDYIHVVDLAEAHVKSMKALFSRPNIGYEVYNCGTGAGVSVLELINCFNEVTGEKLNYEIGPRRPGDIEAIYADVSKVTHDLDWQSKTKLAESLKSSWRWQESLK